MQKMEREAREIAEKIENQRPDLENMAKVIEQYGGFSITAGNKVFDNQQNIIFSTICSFFEGIKREKIILQKMLCLKIRFFSNDKYTKFFSNLLQYANINTNINETTSKTVINNNNQFLSKKHDRLINDNGKLY